MKDWIIRYWLDVVFGGIVAVLAWCYRRLAKRLHDKAVEEAATKDALLAILHDRIYNECKTCIADQYITVDKLRNIEYLYNAYHALGGNGTGTELYNRAKALKIKED